MRPAWGLVAAAVLGLAGEANAQPPPPSLLPHAALDYRVAPGLDCPSEEDVRAEVVRQMEGDPFAGAAPVTGLFHIIVSPKDPDAIEIAVKFEDMVGKRPFETSFKGSPRSGRTCSHLVRTHAIGEIVMELTVQMSRRLRARLAGASACTSSGPTPTCNATRFDFWPEDWPRHLPKPTPDPPPPPERWPWAVRVGVTGWAEVVASSAGSVGVSVDAGVRYRAFSASVELHGDPPLGKVLFPNEGPVSFARVSGAILACGHVGWFVACGVGDVGAFIFPNHIRALPASAFYGAAGARVGIEAPLLPPRLFLRTLVDLRAPILPVNYVAGMNHMTLGQSVFQSAGAGFGLGLALLVELPL